MKAFFLKQKTLEAHLKNTWLGRRRFFRRCGLDLFFFMRPAKVLGDKAVAVTMKLDSVPAREIEEAKDFCTSRGIRQVIVERDQFAAPGFC